MTVGEALRLAKQAYIGGIPSGGLSAYHEKVLLETTLYGLPNQQVEVPSPQPFTRNIIRVEAEEVGPNLQAAGNTISSKDYTLDLATGRQEHTTANGIYYSLNNEIQASPGRPIQPKGSLTIDPTLNGTLKPHGAALLTASFTDLNNFDPVITRPVTDVTLPEPELAVGGWMPQKIWAINSLGESAQLVVSGGQFRKSDTEGVQTGLERLYNNAKIRVFYSDQDSDYLPPTIWEVHSLAANGLQITVTAADESGIQTVIVNYVSGTGQLANVVLTLNSEGNWVGTIPGGTAQTNFYVQAVDNAGNVQMSGNKGLFFTVDEPDLFLPLIRK
jgi:hypothetical protein